MGVECTKWAYTNGDFLANSQNNAILNISPLKGTLQVYRYTYST